MQQGQGQLRKHSHSMRAWRAALSTKVLPLHSLPLLQPAQTLHPRVRILQAHASELQELQQAAGQCNVLVCALNPLEGSLNLVIDMAGGISWLCMRRDIDRLVELPCCLLQLLQL